MTRANPRVSLARQLGGERRRQSHPQVSSTSPFHPFGRSQTGRNSRLVIRHDQATALRLLLPEVHAPAPIVPNDRRQLFAVTA